MNFTAKMKRLVFSPYAKIGLAISAGIILLYFILRAPAKIIETTKAVKEPYQEILLTDGVTRVKEIYSIFSPVNGVLRRIQKNVGDTVKKGEIIATVDWDINRKIQSPTNGKILRIYRESEGPVTMQEKLLDIGNTQEMSLIVKILTEDMNHLDINDRVEISGYQDQILIGGISKIEPAAITEVSSLGVEEQKVPIWIDFPIPQDMGEGYKLDAKIILFEEMDSLIIPSAALVRDKEGWMVFADIKNKARKRKVTISHQSGGKVKILKGLEENEEVLLYPSEDMKDGMKIKSE